MLVFFTHLLANGYIRIESPDNNFHEEVFFRFGDLTNVVFKFEVLDLNTVNEYTDITNLTLNVEWLKEVRNYYNDGHFRAITYQLKNIGSLDNSYYFIIKGLKPDGRFNRTIDAAFPKKPKDVIFIGKYGEYNNKKCITIEKYINY